MPWEEITALDRRKQFIEEFQLEQDGFAELCRMYGVSRQTGYKWVERFEAQGEAGLEDLSRAPRRSPQAMGADVAARVIELRHRHPRWGPRKLRVYLQSRPVFGKRWSCSIYTASTAAVA
jgi:transposase